MAEDLTDVATSATPDQELVYVNGLGLEPLYHMTSPDNTVLLHLKALAGIGYDSNVYATDTDVQGSLFYEGVAGFDLRWVPSQKDVMLLSADFDGMRYTAQPGRNLAGGKADFSYRHTAVDWDAGGEASFARTNDPYIVTGQEIKHDDGHAGIDGTSRWASQGSARLAATIDRTLYLEGAPGVFGKDDRNNTDFGGTARVADAFADQSEAYVQIGVDRRNYDESTFSQPIPIPGTDTLTTNGYNDSTGLLAVVGVRDKLGTRSGLIAEIGVISREYADTFAKDPAFNDKHVVKPALNLAYKWDWEPGSELGARAYSTVVDSVYSNAAWLYGVAVDARYRLSDEYKAALFGELGAYQLKSSGNPDTTIQPDDEVRTTGEISGGAEYVFHPGIGAQLKDVYDDSHSKYYNSFRRNVIEGELGFAF